MDVTGSSLEPIIAEAIARWQLALGDAAAVRLRQVDVRVTNLPGGLLGLTSGNTIWIDSNAAGHGWFIDSTPWDDSEFALAVGSSERQALAGSPAAAEVDLLTVVAHEMGHALGLGHSQDGVMQESLALGVRHPLGCGCAACTGAAKLTQATVPLDILQALAESHNDLTAPAGPAASSTAQSLMLYPASPTDIESLALAAGDVPLGPAQVAGGVPGVLLGGEGDSLVLGRIGSDLLVGGI